MRRLTLILLAVALSLSCTSTRSKTGPDIRYAFVREGRVSMPYAKFDRPMLLTLRQTVGKDYVYFDQNGSKYMTSDAPTVLYVQQRVSRIEESLRMIGNSNLLVPPGNMNPDLSGVIAQQNVRWTTEGQGNIAAHVSHGSRPTQTYLVGDIQRNDHEIRDRLDEAIRDGLAQPVL